MESALITPILRIILGLLFTLSSIFKMPDLKGFSTIVASYGLLPKQLVKPSSYSLPFIELAIGLALLFGIYLREAAFLGIIMMMNANIFVIYAYFTRKLDNCGCYGIAFKVPVNLNKLIENLVWTIAFAALFLLNL